MWIPNVTLQAGVGPGHFVSGRTFSSVRRRLAPQQSTRDPPRRKRGSELSPALDSPSTLKLKSQESSFTRPIVGCNEQRPSNVPAHVKSCRQRRVSPQPPIGGRVVPKFPSSPSSSSEQASKQAGVPAAGYCDRYVRTCMHARRTGDRPRDVIEACEAGTHL